jgi:hypothetical protein
VNEKKYTPKRLSSSQASVVMAGSDTIETPFETVFRELGNELIEAVIRTPSTTMASVLVYLSGW